MTTSKASQTERENHQKVIIKKYANRRLYNTSTSSYVTLNELCEMTKKGIHFVVYDIKTHKEITHAILTQIIAEQESKGQNLLPTVFLRHLISLYDKNMQWFILQYLEYSILSFIKHHNEIQKYFQSTLKNMLPFAHFENLEQINKHNLQLFEQAMHFFDPFQFIEKGAPSKLIEVERLFEEFYKRLLYLSKNSETKNEQLLKKAEELSQQLETLTKHITELHKTR